MIQKKHIAVVLLGLIVAVVAAVFLWPKKAKAATQVKQKNEGTRTGNVSDYIDAANGNVIGGRSTVTAGPGVTFVDPCPGDNVIWDADSETCTPLIEEPDPFERMT